jgi:hypothetical protein
MADEDTQEQTEEATQDGAETVVDADTNDAEAKLKEQAEIDRRISAGIKAYIDKSSKADEKKRLEDEQIAAINDGEYKTALDIVQGKLDALEASQGEKDYQIEAQNVLVKLGMSKYAETLIPMTKDITQLLQATELFKAGMEKGIADGVNERLDTGPTRTPTNTNKAPDKTPDKMNRDEFIEWKVANKLV